MRFKLNPLNSSGISVDDVTVVQGGGSSSSGGAVTSVNSRTGDVVITETDVLPSQTGNNGKYLTTDGSATSWATLAGGGDMSAATYDPATVSEQLVGLTATQTLTNKTLTTPTITLKQSTTPTPTTEGDIQWDTDGNQIKVGDGAGTKVFSDDSVVLNADNHTSGTTNKVYTATEQTKLSGIETGAEVNNISDVNATDLTDGGDSTLHFHSADRDRANHTGTQTASTISDFDTEVANNSAVAANTAKVTNATHTGEVTGATALTIADNVVDEANLKVDNTPTDDYYLAAKASAAGGLTWKALPAGGTGTVTSVAATVPTGFTVSGSPITTTGTLGIGYDTGYQGYTTTEATKLSGIETGADVTDTTNVTAAGALMDSEVTDLAGIKALNTSTLATKTGTETLTNKTLDNPQINISTGGSINDTSGNRFIQFSAGVSPVNYIAVRNEATGLAPYIQATGADVNVDLDLNTKGSGEINLNANVTTTGTIDGRDVATDGTKLDGIEANADVTDATNVAAAGAYMAGGTDVALADGGTGNSLTDPNADRILFWDDSGGVMTWLTASTGLTISGTSMTVRTSSATQTGIVELATTAETTAATDTARAVTPAGIGAERTATATLTNKTLTSPVINSPTGLVKADVGLGNVDNTSDATKKADIIGTIYPVGSLYTSTLSTNPGTLLGVGTWVAFGEGRVMVGKAAAGTFSTAGATGGAETHTLTESEMPSHNHTQRATDSTANNVSPIGRNHANTTGVANFRADGTIGNMGTTTTSTGGGGAHNNLQPYIVVYMWERTA